LKPRKSAMSASVRLRWWQCHSRIASLALLWQIVMGAGLNEAAFAAVEERSR
jgi:hypothetical protein